MKTQTLYRYSTPYLINKSLDWGDKDINLLLEKAMLLLGKLDVYSISQPLSDEVENMFKIREAVSSNRIVGISSFYPQYYSDSKKDNLDRLFIRNYKDAIEWGMKELEIYPLSIRLIKSSHKLLYKDIHADEINPGQTRDALKDMLFNRKKEYDYIPPGKEELKTLILDARKFWNNDKLKIPQIIKFAISLYQFENLLPFVDGNGRTARLLTMFQLKSVGYLQKPVLSMSVYFEKHKIQYYKLINQVRKDHNVEVWIKFFLTGVVEMAQNGIDIYTEVNRLYSDLKVKISERTGIKRRANALKLLDILFRYPFINTKTAAKNLDVTFQTANTIIEELVELGILFEKDNYKRNRVFCFSKYIDIFWPGI